MENLGNLGEVAELFEEISKSDPSIKNILDISPILVFYIPEMLYVHRSAWVEKNVIIFLNQPEEEEYFFIEEFRTARKEYNPIKRILIYGIRDFSKAEKYILKIQDNCAMSYQVNFAKSIIIDSLEIKKVQKLLIFA